ncbi:hypothetical protein Tco_0673510 [Tanacetum coccineum]
MCYDDSFLLHLVFLPRLGATFYDPFLKAGLGYQNPERLKKAIKAQPKMYDGESIQSTKLIIDSPDSEEILKDAKEKIPIGQTYISTPSTSNVTSESSKEMTNLPVKKMPNLSKLLKLFVKLDKSIASDRTPMLEKGSYVSWASRFMRFLDNNQEEGERMRHSIEVRPLMHGPEKTIQQRYSRLVDEFDKFVAVEGESLSSVYERLTILEEDYQGDMKVDAQEDKLTTAMKLLARAITQRYSTPTNNHLRTSSNTRNQVVIQDGRLDIQSKNVSYAENGHYTRDCPQPKVPDEKYFREQMLLAMKDEAGGNLNKEENDCMLDNHYGDDSLEELNAAVIMMERI